VSNSLFEYRFGGIFGVEMHRVVVTREGCIGDDVGLADNARHRGFLAYL
jgi:hypothetical protein